MNTLIPYQSGIIRDARPHVMVPMEDALPLDDELAWHPAAKALKELYDAGDVAVVQGVGWEHLGGPGLGPLPLPRDGHLADLRVRQDRHRRLAREGRARVRSGLEEPAHGGQLRPGPAQVPGGIGRPRHLGRRPRQVRSDDGGRAGGGARPGHRHLQSACTRPRSTPTACTTTWRRPAGACSRARTCWRQHPSSIPRTWSTRATRSRRHYAMSPACTPPVSARASSIRSTLATTTTRWRASSYRSCSRS